MSAWRADPGPPAPRLRRVRALCLAAAALALTLAVPGRLGTAQTPPGSQPPGGQTQPAPTGQSPAGDLPTSEGPRSLLPAGRFAPPAAPIPEAEPLPGPAGSGPDGAPGAAPAITPVAPGDLADTLPPLPITQVDLQRLGTLDAGARGMPLDSWARSDPGRVLPLLWQTRAPGPSRWASLTLTRLLMSDAPPPPGADPLRFLGARAQLLARSGFAMEAQQLVGEVPVSLYPRGLYSIAGYAHLAGFDLAATCPLATNAVVFSRETVWPLLMAICSALQTDDEGAALGLDLARQDQRANAFDVLMADRVVTAVSGGGGSGMLRWPASGRITPFRLATIYASGQALPADALLRTHAGAHGWLTRAAAVDPLVRRAAGHVGVTAGIIRPDQWRTLWAARAARFNANALAAAPEGVYVRAWTSPSPADRIKAIRVLLGQARTERQRLSMKLLVAGPAAAMPVRPGFAADVPDLVRAMVVADEWQAAHRWWPALAAHARQGEAGAEAAMTAIWPLLELTDWANRIPSAPERIEQWIELQGEAGRDAQARRGSLLVAALQGLGYRSVYDADLPGRVEPDREIDDPLLRQLAAAGQAKARGDVVLLAARALGSRWSDVTPEALREVVRAYVAVGLSSEARMIAVEAIVDAGG